MRSKILGACLVVLIAGNLVGCRQEPPAAINDPPATSERGALPNSPQALPAYLDSILPVEAQGKTRIIPLAKNPERYMVLCKFTLAPNYEDEKAAMEKIARDFIFASYESVYAANLDIVSSTIIIKCPTKQPGLSVGVGKLTADTLDSNTWSNRTADPAAFIAWLKKNKHNAPDALRKCSYAGIYAK